MAGNGAEIAGRHGRRHRQPQLTQPVRPLRRRVFLGPQVVARPRHVGVAHLDGLRQRAQQRDLGHRVAAGAGAGMSACSPLVGDQAFEGGDADVGRRFPDRDAQAGLLDPLQDGATGGIADRPRIDPRGVALALGRVTRQAAGVALDDLADGVADRLQEMIARCQAVGGGGEAAAAGRQRVGVVRMHDLVGDPDPLVRIQVGRFDPEDLQVRDASGCRGAAAGPPHRPATGCARVHGCCRAAAAARCARHGSLRPPP